MLGLVYVYYGDYLLMVGKFHDYYGGVVIDYGYRVTRVA